MTTESSLVSSIRNNKNIATAFAAIAKALPHARVYAQAHIDRTSQLTPRPRTWIAEHYDTFAPKVWRLAAYLRSLGVTRGTAVAILSYTRPEWLLADMGILSASGFSVSIYQSINPQEVGYILNDSGAKIIFAENDQQVEKLLSLIASPCAIPETEDAAAREVTIDLQKIITFETTVEHELVISLESILADETLANTAPPTIEETTQDDVASFVYTSGTTGPPKGVVQTHGNHLANVWQASTTGLFAPDGDIFLFLPLAHSFAKLIGFIGLLTPTSVKIPAVYDTKTSTLNPHSVMLDMKEGSATIAPVMPRILEKMRAGVREKELATGLGGFLLRSTVSAALARLRAIRAGKTPALSTQLVFALTGFLRRKVQHALFGPNFQHAVSGGAKLPTDIAEFFVAMEMPVYEGYGLTETCVATNVNPKDKIRIGSVGPALPEVEMHIAEDEEIFFRGPNITRGYHNRPTATAASWDSEGWFHTGDLGRVDDDGYLYITGRKKELIVTAGGKKIPPAPIEEKLSASPLISTALVFGEGKPYCIALVTVDREVLAKTLSAEEIANDDALQALLWGEVEKVNATLSQFETLKKMLILPVEPSIENGLLTPSMKVKKNAVFAQYAEQIEALYASGRSE